MAGMKRYCPCCSQLVTTTYTSGGKEVDTTNSGWLFEEHDRDDERGGVIQRTRCPGSQRNRWTAEHSF